MNTTSSSLLSRLRNPADDRAWHEFDARYRDLLINFCRRRGLPHVDAEDVVQRVFADLARSLPGFTYDTARGRFRDYLFRCVSNVISDWAARPNRRWQAVEELGGAEPQFDSRSGGDDSAAAQAWEREWEDHHFRLAMQTVRRTFDEKSAAIFERSIAGATVTELAQDFSMSEPAIHKVRQRIRDRMEELIAAQVREEDAIDDDGS